MSRALIRILCLVTLVTLSSCSGFAERYRQTAQEHWRRKAMIDAYERKYSVTTSCRPGIFDPQTLYCTTY